MKECPVCKNMVAPEDWGMINSCCDECFEKQLEEEEAEFDIFNGQYSECFLCNQKLSGWMVKDLEGSKRAICWPSCGEKLPPPIQLTVKDGKISKI
jgi:hypothetical protein